MTFKFTLKSTVANISAESILSRVRMARRGPSENNEASKIFYIYYIKENMSSKTKALERSNALAKAVLLFDTLKAVLISIIFAMIGIAVVYAGSTVESDNPKAIIMAGCAFFVVGIGIGVFQYFTVKNIRSGPPGTATQWYKDRKHQMRMQKHQMRMQKRNNPRLRSPPALIRIF